MSVTPTERQLGRSRQTASAKPARPKTAQNAAVASALYDITVPDEAIHAEIRVEPFENRNGLAGNAQPAQERG